MRYVVINRACDGTHISTHATLEKAQKRVENMVGKREYPFEVNIPYISDWGNVLTIEERPGNWTSNLERRVSEAFDANECGFATKAQIRLLHDKGFLIGD
jgi:hypothetical protein